VYNVVTMDMLQGLEQLSHNVPVSENMTNFYIYRRKAGFYLQQSQFDLEQIWNHTCCIHCKGYLDGLIQHKD
jgi:hypothetical protein